MWLGYKGSVSKERWLRGANAGADAVRGESRETGRGPLMRRSRFHTMKLTCTGRDTHLSLTEQRRLQLWATRG